MNRRTCINYSVVARTELRTHTKDWDQMRKNHVDNMDSYLTRKEERLKAKKTTLQADGSSQDASEMDNIPVPHKKSKLETNSVL